jgi:uncharacterized protein YjbJ (UPF0337 family)
LPLENRDGWAPSSYPVEEQTEMDWDQVARDWQQLKGKAKLQWRRLTDDELDTIAGSRDKLLAKIQEVYVITEEEAEEQIVSWERWVRDK